METSGRGIITAALRVHGSNFNHSDHADGTAGKSLTIVAGSPSIQYNIHVYVTLYPRAWDGKNMSLLAALP